MTRALVRIAVAFLVTGCSSGGPPASPRADASIDAPADAVADAAGQAPPTPGYEGGYIGLDGCAATGTCPPAEAVVLASGQASPAGIALDDASVYWVDLGFLSDAAAGGEAGARTGAGVMSCPKAGCPDGATVLASGTWSGASTLAVDAENVYWLASGTVLACPLAGCTGAPQVVWSGQGPLYDIAADSTGVYFSSQGTESVYFCPPTGCADGGATLWSGSDAAVPFQVTGPLALDETSLYLVAGPAEAVSACDKTNCAATLREVAAGDVQTLVGKIAVDGVNVYVTDLNGGRVLYAPKNGTDGGLSTLVAELSLPVDLATDGTNVYFTDDGNFNPQAGDGGFVDASFSGIGRVGACAVSGCGNVATTLAGFLNEPLGVAVDSTTVYFTDFGGAYGPSFALAESDAGRVLAYRKPASP